MNVNWVGPTLMRYGSAQQKGEHLSRISKGDVLWCQGFSEPNAGSDLASLTTRGDRRGDVYVVNGQKVWTSYCKNADFCFLLVRTDPQERRHRGVSVLLMPMSLPGLASTALLLVILSWNEAFWSINLSSSHAAPLTVFIASYSSPEGLFWAKLSAASLLAVAPILIVGWLSQKQLVRGLTFGAVK